MNRALMRYVPYIGAVLVAVLAIAPHLAFADAGTLQSGFTIVPDLCNCYQGAGWGCVLSVFQNLTTFVVYIGVLGAVAAMAYAGFLMVTNATNPGNIGKARTAMLDAVVGLVIVLAAWLIVNTLISVLTTGTLTSYSAVLGTSSANCLPTAVDQQGSVGTTTGLTPTGTPPAGSTCATGQTCTAGFCGPAQTTCGSATCSANQVCSTDGQSCVAAQTCTATPTGTGTVQYVGDAPGEVGDESSQLSGMLSCMAGKATFQVTSISDHLISSGQKTFQQCDQQGGCAHAVHSCHYGGVSCVGKSYAADIRNLSDNSPIVSAANSCGATWSGQEADHLHVSIGASCGCN